MPTPRKAGRFGGSAAHHKHIVANLATELIRHGRIRTTHAKAKTVQPTAERLITYAKRGDVHSRRLARKIVRDGDVLHHLFAEVGPAFADRDGGYTRVLKLEPRKGDAAPMALIEFVAEVSGAGEDAAEAESRRRWTLRRRGAEAAAGEAQPEEAEEPTAAAEPEDEGERPEADPAEVEARLGAEESEGEADEPDAVSGDPEGEPAESPEADAPEDPGADQEAADEDEGQGRS